MAFNSEDFVFMTEALRLAEQGLYTTSPNPRVGCVITRNGQIIGQGWHRWAGEAHAEVEALQEAGEAAQGATAYVSLEPCNHYGKTPPCAEALIKAGIKRVVAAMVDPNPLVAGQGLARLQQAGIQTEVGLLQEQANGLNIGFVSRMTRGRPWIRLKIAASLDGKTALKNGASQWITGPAARVDVHRLRARSCAILTGINTVLMDDPLLTVREVATPRQPLRIVLDSQLRIPLTAKMLQEPPVLIVTVDSDSAKAARLTAMGVEVMVAPMMESRIDLAWLLAALGKRGLNEITVEAGATLNGALLKAGWVDELVLYTAPSLLGGEARPMFGGIELTEMAQKIKLTLSDLRQVGEDVRLTARIKSI